jgi:hypothetical protein
MSTAKEEVRRILDQLPDEATYLDIHYHIHVREKIEERIQLANHGDFLSEEEVEARMQRWLAE